MYVSGMKVFSLSLSRAIFFHKCMPRHCFVCVLNELITHKFKVKYLLNKLICSTPSILQYPISHIPCAIVLHTLRHM